jgi:hypothetical protein
MAQGKRRLTCPHFFLEPLPDNTRWQIWQKPARRSIHNFRDGCTPSRRRPGPAAWRMHCARPDLMPYQENDMTRHKILYGVLLAALLLPGCVVAPADHRGPEWVVAPALPVIVELGVEPYYFHSGFYYYYQERDHRWSYSRERTGPWRELPRDRYPREIRYKDRGHDHDMDRNRDHRD